MQAKISSTIKGFRAYVKKMKSYEEALGVLYWDLRTGAPKKGVDMRSEVIGELSAELFNLSISEQMEQYLSELEQENVYAELDPTNKKIVEECRKEFDKSKKIPPSKYKEYVVLTSQAESVWEEAKHANDYARFQPYLEKIVAYNKEFIDLWGYEGHKYNTLLDMYEPKMTVEKLDHVFGKLREELVPLVTAIAQSKAKPRRDFVQQAYAIEKQKQFGQFLLKEMGYDFEAGRLDESVHPFATGLNSGDVRITTKYIENDPLSSIYSSLHEGGHALYEQNISTELAGTPLATGTSMGIHESQSRFWENMIGRSKGFCSRYYGDLQKLFPEHLNDVSVEQFYLGLNEVKPSLIRIEADELTYNLHIMIRYEIEKAIFNDEVQVKDLPEIWKAKYQEYLGVSPPDDASGVLQDVHWSGGGFGYFPSYALGNMYAAQLMNTMKQQLPELESWISAGHLLPIKDWLVEQVYRFGKLLTPGEIIQNVTGEELNPEYLIHYFKQKYGQIYELYD